MYNPKYKIFRLVTDTTFHGIVETQFIIVFQNVTQYQLLSPRMASKEKWFGGHITIHGIWIELLIIYIAVGIFSSEIPKNAS